MLALGPVLRSGNLSIPLPYQLLYSWVPGFDGLRNPYRAAFIATILLALPAAYGAAWLGSSDRAGNSRPVADQEQDILRRLDRVWC